MTAQLPLLDYDGTPYRVWSDTSREAAVSVSGRREERMRAALAAYRAAGENGLTDYELAAIMHWGQTTPQNIRDQLRRRGLVEQADTRRPSITGRACQVWRIRA